MDVYYRMLKRQKEEETEHASSLSKKAKNESPMFSIFPTWNSNKNKRPFGVAYEEFVFSEMRASGTSKHVTEPSEGDYDLIYISYDAFDRRWYDQQGLYEEESLPLHRTCHGTLNISKNKDGLIVGKVAYKNHENALIPSNGSFSFQEDPELVKMKHYENNGFHYQVQERFCWADVGTDTEPKVKITRCCPWALGLVSNDNYEYNPWSWNGRYGQKFNGTRDEAVRMLEEFNDVKSSWIRRHLDVPELVAQTIHKFLLPPPVLLTNRGDLILETHWDNRSNITYTIARPRESSEDLNLESPVFEFVMYNENIYEVVESRIRDNQREVRLKSYGRDVKNPPNFVNFNDTHPLDLS